MSRLLKQTALCFCLLAPCAWACSDGSQAGSGSGNGNGNGNGNGTSNGGTPAVDAGDPNVSSCRGRSFGAEATWELPIPARDLSWTEADTRQTFVDVHGDRKSDLVLTEKTGDTSVGKSKWLVYKNNGAGFDTTPEVWNLPIPARDLFWTEADSRQSFVDVHGDGKPDLVLTEKTGDASVGKSKWLVYKNNGAGFDTTPEVWNLPIPARDLSWTEADSRQSFVDVHGDGRPDLVLTEKTGDTSVGKSKWLVYKNNGAGFDTTPEVWDLPIPARDLSWTEADTRQTFVDVHGDRKPDLILTQKTGDSSVGKSKWLVYKNNGAGFDAAPETWNLPVPARDLFWTEADTRQSFVDVHGDGKPDLILTQKTGDTSVGKSKWLVYPNNGSGFDAAESWDLPIPARDLSWTEADTRQTFVDVHGDIRSDLVLTQKTGDTSVGKSKWLVYKNNCE